MSESFKCLDEALSAFRNIVYLTSLETSVK